jgi:hypothetical protein
MRTRWRVAAHSAKAGSDHGVARKLQAGLQVRRRVEFPNPRADASSMPTSTERSTDDDCTLTVQPDASNDRDLPYLRLASAYEAAGTSRAPP